MNGEEAVQFLDVHIEGEILARYSGQREKFQEAMNVLRNLAKRDKFETLKFFDDNDGFDEKGKPILWRRYYCPACNVQVASHDNFCSKCGKHLKEEIHHE